MTHQSSGFLNGSTPGLLSTWVQIMVVATSRWPNPLADSGTAEIWSFVVQYVYQNAPFGQMSQPVSITVRG